MSSTAAVSTSGEKDAGNGVKYKIEKETNGENADEELMWQERLNHIIFSETVWLLLRLGIILQTLLVPYFQTYSYIRTCSRTGIPALSLSTFMLVSTIFFCPKILSLYV